METVLAEVSSAGHRGEGEVLQPEEELRAGMYRLLAGLLSAPPQAAELTQLAALTGDATGLGQAVAALAGRARAADPVAVSDEYQNLFIGLGRGEVIPFASYYLTGFLQEKPLAKLRQDMQRLGIERDPEVAEPEDHIASVLELMAGLIDGSLGDQLPLSEQKALYERHVASWAAYFFRDLEAAESASFYAAVAVVGSSFIQIEDEAFMMV
jgi:TorA maturation chaperone TorD